MAVQLTQEGKLEFIEGTTEAERAVWVSAYAAHLTRTPMLATVDAQYAVAAGNAAVEYLRNALGLPNTVAPIGGE
jgi:hypothetical protein